MRFVKSQLGFLLFGFIIWLPIGVVILVFTYLFNALEGLGRDILGFLLPARSLHTGLGTLVGVAIFYLTGVLLQKTSVGNIFSRIPLIGVFFGKGNGKVITLDRLLKLQPCLFLYSPTCLSYGWILSEEKIKLRGEEAPFTLVNVYYPNVPSIVTGQVFPLRKGAVIRLGNFSKEVIDLLLYGMRSPESLKYLPWEDESEEQFIKRARLFGLNIGTE